VADATYNSINEWTSDGVKSAYELSFAGGYISREHIQMYVADTSGNVIADVYSFNWVADFQVNINPVPPSGYKIRWYRKTPVNAPLVGFSNGSIINDGNLDENAEQSIFAIAEMQDSFGYNTASDEIGANAALAQAAAATATAAAATATAVTGLVTEMVGTPQMHGAKADCFEFTAGTLNLGNPTSLVLTDTGWKSSAVTLGNPICVMGAGLGGQPLLTTIAGVTGQVITLATAASTAVVNTSGEFGTDDTSAIQAACDAGYSEIFFGNGSAFKYLLAAAPANYGTFSHTIEGTLSFPRGVLQPRSNQRLYGGRAKLLVIGGRKLGTPFFYSSFWASAPQLTNWALDGLVFDGNNKHMYRYDYPGVLGPSGIWQHQCMASLAYADTIEITRCVITDLQGDGVRTMAGQFTSDQITRGVHFHNNEVTKCWGVGIAPNGYDIEINNNWFHGDGFLVAAIDVEVLANDVATGRIHIHSNTFDFRDGYAPTERYYLASSQSTEAIDHKTRFRRATSIAWYVGAGDGEAVSDLRGDVAFTNNRVYEGNIDSNAFKRVKITGNHIVNKLTEDLTGHSTISPAAISLSSPAVAQAYGYEIASNLIDHAGNGAGIDLYALNEAYVHDNTVMNCGRAGIQLNATSGRVERNLVLNCASNGVVDGTFPNRYKSGIWAIGNSAADGAASLHVRDNEIRDDRTTPLMTWAVELHVSNNSTVIGNLWKGTVNGFADMAAYPAMQYFGNIQLVDGVPTSPIVASVGLQAPSFTTAAGFGVISNGRLLANNYMQVQGASGQPRRVQFLQGTTGLMDIIVNDGATGMAFNLYQSGEVRQPLVVGASGELRLNKSLVVTDTTVPAYDTVVAAIAAGIAGGTIIRGSDGTLRSV
jgi:hypothetical protein